MEKSPDAFRTISEVADLLDTPAHVLRFWESRFSQVRPVKRAGGRRYYRPADLALLGGIKKLLHEDGMTIRGVQKILREQGVRHVAGLSIYDISQLGQEETPAPAAPPVRRKATMETALRSVTSAPASPVQADWLSEAAHPWPATPSPDVAAPGDDLVHDPEDTDASAPEAPMELDAPLLPAERPSAEVHSFEGRAPQPATPPDYVADTVQKTPAAALLRAMDALRARDKRTELRDVYGRLTDLRERMAKENAKPLD